jgi:hypothetical protein
VPDPTNEAIGDGFLMRQGYTLVWVGWQFDIPRRSGLMALDAPPTLERGQPVTGRVATSFTPNTADPTYPLDDMGRYADTTRYPPVDPTSAAKDRPETNRTGNSWGHNSRRDIARLG